MIKPPELFHLLEGDKPPLVLDVRESLEDGMVRGSVNIPISELEDRWTELSAEQKIVVMCPKGGGAAAMAVEILQNHGFQALSRLEGGFNAWLAENLPVVSIAS